MKLTTRGRYAVTAMLDLAINGGSRPVSLADISGRQEISLSYLEQLFAKLRREQLVTLPVRHFLDTYVIDRGSGVSFHQAVRGEVLGGAHVPLKGESADWAATRPLFETWCREVYKLFPPLARISVLRQWAGTRGFTPDGAPIFGPGPDVPGLWMVCGQSGTGLMLAPAIAEAIARELAGLPPGVDWEVYSPRRFARGAELWERTPQD